MIALVPIHLMREIIYDYWSKVKDDHARYMTWCSLMPLEELCDTGGDDELLEVKLHD